MTYLEVRCCCQPQKLLGWLPVPDDRVHDGQFVRFPTRPIRFVVRPLDPIPLFRRVYQVNLQVRELQEVLLLSELVERDHRMHLAAQALGPGHRVRFRLALSSEDTPIDILRHVDGFVEA